MEERDRTKAAQPVANALDSLYLTVAEAAALLRTTRKAVYALVERGLLPGVRHVGRRVLINRAELINSIEEGAASSGRSRR